MILGKDSKRVSSEESSVVVSSYRRVGCQDLLFKSFVVLPNIAEFVLLHVLLTDFADFSVQGKVCSRTNL